MPQKTGVGVTEEKTAAAKAAPQKDKKTARSASAKPGGYVAQGRRPRPQASGRHIRLGRAGGVRALLL